MAIRYRFARSTDDQLIDVQAMQAADRRRGAPFSCLSCERELIPALGEIQDHHFRHKHEQDCSSETYRHQLAKRIFAATYERCVREGQPFHLIQSAHGSCSFYQDRFGFTCTRVEPTHDDLTHYFERVSVEAAREGFRADILLWSEHREDYLFIEMVVTHECDPAKLNSGIRIIEVAIGTEDDALALDRTTLDGYSPAVTLHNFKPRLRSSCEGNCNRHIPVFIVYKSGKLRLDDFPIKEVTARSFRQRTRYYEEVSRADWERGGWEFFREKVREVHFAGTPLRHCFLCRYHGAPTSGTTTWCRTKKRECKRNEAVTCEKFVALNSPEECSRADERNERYLQDQAQQQQEWAEARAAERRKARQLQTSPMVPASSRRRAKTHWQTTGSLYGMHAQGLLSPPPESPQWVRIVDLIIREHTWHRHTAWLTCWTRDSCVVAKLELGGDAATLPLALIEAEDARAMDQEAMRVLELWGNTELPGARVKFTTDWMILENAPPRADHLPFLHRWDKEQQGWQII